MHKMRGEKTGARSIGVLREPRRAWVVMRKAPPPLTRAGMKAARTMDGAWVGRHVGRTTNGGGGKA